jgi:hypothetical protein
VSEAKDMEDFGRIQTAYIEKLRALIRCTGARFGRNVQTYGTGCEQSAFHLLTVNTDMGRGLGIPQDMRLFEVAGLLLVCVSTAPGTCAVPEHGLASAKRWCASCHVVSAEQQRARVDVPPFATMQDLQISIRGIWPIFC